MTEGPWSVSQKNARHAECEEDAASWLTMKNTHKTETTRGPSVLPASNVHRRRYLSTYICIYTDIMQGQSYTCVICLLGVGAFPKKLRLLHSLSSWLNLSVQAEEKDKCIYSNKKKSYIFLNIANDRPLPAKHWSSPAAGASCCLGGCDGNDI